MIELNDRFRMELDRKSSKGNQLKFIRNGIWYKADYTGYEGLAEYAVSRLLQFSTLGESEYVVYAPEQIVYGDRFFNGCKSADFTGGWQLITLERLFSQFYGSGLNSLVYALEDHTQRLKVMAEQVERLTGIRDFGIYLAKMLAVDTLFLNEDRHAHNMAVMINSRKEYKLCPLFDHGACLLSDTAIDYPLGQDVLSLMRKARPKTFCQSFEEQLDIAERLYGEQIHFRFGYDEIRNIVDQADMYPEEIRRRVVDILMEQRRKYSYLFLK